MILRGFMGFVKRVKAGGESARKEKGKQKACPWSE
jgi:hypothetical protein